MDYLGAANQVGDWLLATAQQGDDGWSWPEKPAASPKVDPSLGWGTAAPTLFFLEAYRTTGEARWLEAAHEGTRWMGAHLDESIEAEAGCGLLTGVGGWVFVLDELADATNDDDARTQAGRILDSIVRRANPVAAGVHWHDLTEILWGTAGIGCLLLAVGDRYLGPAAVDLATRAGDWLLTEAEPAEPGLRWHLGHGYPSPRRFPNFAHGAAGIGFFMARLAQVTGELRFLDAALGAHEWITSTARTDDDTLAAYHHLPDGTDLYTLGWCHGPPGLGWFYRQLELTTGDAGWRTRIRQAAKADRISGIPEQREPGFWDNVARCCGSAGVAEFFLDLHWLEGRPDDLGFATTMVDDILDRAITDGAGMRWSNYEFRADEPHLPPETTYMQGAPGIGSTLLRMHRHLAGDYWTVRWPHAPTWTPAG